MDPEVIDISVADPPTDDPPHPVSELLTDDFDIFQGDFMS
jgi:hypothetical protein